MATPVVHLPCFRCAKRCREVVVEALKQNDKAIVHAAPEARSDPKLHAAMRGNSEVLRFLGFDSSRAASGSAFLSQGKRKGQPTFLFLFGGGASPILTHTQVARSVQPTVSLPACVLEPAMSHLLSWWVGEVFER